MPLRIVHAADCHLDAPCLSLDARVRARVRAAEREAFTRLCDLAIAREVDALVLAGDLFDGSSVRLATRMWLVNELGRVCAAGIHVVVASGNHDPGSRLAGLAIEWPHERFLLADGPDPVKLELPSGTIVAVGHAHEKLADNLALTLPPAPAGTASVAVLHAQVNGSIGARDRYAPCTPEDLIERGYGYVALGHVHLRQAVVADPPAWYAGCLQAHDVGEPGQKGAIVASLEADGRLELEFVPLAPVRFERVELIDPECAPSQLADRIRAELGELAAEELIVRVILRGRSTLAASLRDPDQLAAIEDELAAELGALAVELRADRLHPPLDVSRHRGQPHVLGVALELVERALSDDALVDELTPATLAGEHSDRRVYVRSLLEELEVETAEVLLR